MINLLRKLPLDKILCFIVALLIVDGWLAFGISFQAIDYAAASNFNPDAGQVDWDNEIYKLLTSDDIHGMYGLFGFQGGLVMLAIVFLIGFSLTRALVNKLATIKLENIIYKGMRTKSLDDSLSYIGPSQIELERKLERLPISGDLRRYLYVKLVNIFVSNNLNGTNQSKAS
ncbi:MAG: hypothetical protein FWE37_01920 [Spirochaetaceae bacterium]|nr:hypothetical protein [Spirochaetaceae bacterium]